MFFFLFNDNLEFSMFFKNLPIIFFCLRTWRLIHIRERWDYNFYLAQERILGTTQPLPFLIWVFFNHSLPLFEKLTDMIISQSNL